MLRENGRERRVTKQRAFIKALTSLAIKGDIRAINALVACARNFAPDHTAPKGEELDPEDLDILENFIRRKRKTGEDAERVAGVPELVYVGNHGLELEPEAEAWATRLGSFLAETRWPRTEDKRLSAALHFRDVEDEAAARATLDEIAAAARAQGFLTRYGRKVLEILPPLEADKGTAVRRLLTDRDLRRALYAGDDTTDIDAFRALDGLEVAVRVAVASPEGPAELREAADIVVDSPAGLLALLREL